MAQGLPARVSAPKHGGDYRQRVAAVLPHLRRACAVEARLLQARRETATLTDALNRVTDAVAMLDRGGRVVFANPRAAGVRGCPVVRWATADPDASALAQGLGRRAQGIALTILSCLGTEALPDSHAPARRWQRQLDPSASVLVTPPKASS